MKKILTFLIGILLCFELIGCKEKTPKKSFDITTTFSFYKDGNKKEMFETNKFEINTKIYVYVDFDIKKNIEAEEIISFVVQIPYAEYYSTKDFYSGTVEPKENPYTQINANGEKYTVMELNHMNFTIGDNEIHHYHYIFEIEANQICNEADFIVRFKPENTNLTVSVNGMDDNKSKTTYTFFKRGEQWL